jgi:hypothetical protein
LKGSVTKEEVVKALDRWGNALVSIATAYGEKKDYVSLAKGALDTAYAYHLGPVLFKPTLASKVMFRGTHESALSYFVGGNPKFDEDAGFAINPWKKAEFEIAGVVLGDNHAIVMGNKHLTRTDGNVVKANFTMGFTRDPKDGDLKINLHHSSLPYVPPK